MLPDLALLSILIGSNYPCLELIFMVPQVLEPLKFDCKCLFMGREGCNLLSEILFFFLCQTSILAWVANATKTLK